MASIQSNLNVDDEPVGMTTARQMMHDDDSGTMFQIISNELKLAVLKYDKNINMVAARGCMELLIVPE